MNSSSSQTVVWDWTGSCCSVLRMGDDRGSGSTSKNVQLKHYYEWMHVLYFFIM